MPTVVITLLPSPSMSLPLFALSVLGLLRRNPVSGFFADTSQHTQPSVVGDNGDDDDDDSDDDDGGDGSDDSSDCNDDDSDDDSDDDDNDDGISDGDGGGDGDGVGGDDGGDDEDSDIDDSGCDAVPVRTDSVYGWSKSAVKIRPECA